MRRKQVLLGVAAAVALMTVGCQSKYEKVEVPGTVKETASQTEKDAAGQSETASSGAADDGTAGKADLGADGQKIGAAGQTAGISENKAELTTESAPAMETRDETVYVKANHVKSGVSPAPGGRGSCCSCKRNCVKAHRR